MRLWQRLTCFVLRNFSRKGQAKIIVKRLGGLCKDLEGLISPSRARLISP